MTPTRYVAPPVLPDWITATPWPTFTPRPTATLRPVRVPAMAASPTAWPTETPIPSPSPAVGLATWVAEPAPTPTVTPEGEVIFPLPEGCSEGPIEDTKWELIDHHFFESRDLKIPFEMDATTHVFYRDANPRHLLWVTRFNYPEDETAVVELAARWSMDRGGELHVMTVQSLAPLQVGPDVPPDTVEERRVTGLGMDAPGWWRRGKYVVDLWSPISDCPLAYHAFEVK